MTVHGCEVLYARLVEWEIDGLKVVRQEIIGVDGGHLRLSITGWVEPREVVRVKVEPHDPYRNLRPASTPLPGQILVKLPGDAEWRHLGLMAEVADAAEIAWQYQQQDAVRSYAWVDGEGRLVELSSANTEG